MRTLAAGLAQAQLACGSEAPLPARRDGPPNIVMIPADDHGWGDYGFMGSELAETPNIDALARGGSVFPVTYDTASICRPSQISLLTGLDPIQWENAVAQPERVRAFREQIEAWREHMAEPVDPLPLPVPLRVGDAPPAARASTRS